MTEKKAQTFKSPAEYRTAYYPEGPHSASPEHRTAADVGREIADASLEVLRDSMEHEAEPSPRHAEQAPGFSNALAGLTSRNFPKAGHPLRQS